MRKILFVLGLMMGMWGNAQNFKYLDSSCEWRYYLYGSGYGETLITKFIDGDTLINNKKYFVLKYMARGIDPVVPTNNYTYSKRDSIVSVLTYVSEDSLNNFIVFHFSLNWVRKQQMLYDFDSMNKINIGQTFPKNTLTVPWCNGIDGYYSSCVLGMKDTIIFGGDTLKYYKSYNGYFNRYFGVIEGIGSSCPSLCTSSPFCSDSDDAFLQYYSKRNIRRQFFFSYPTFNYDSFPIPIRTRKLILPLSLLSFSAQQQQSNVLLNWQTANETNLSHFNIQRSNNGNNFTTIGTTKANNKSSNEYSFTDDLKTNTQPTNTIYYRIEAVDLDGKKTYSEIKSFNIQNSSFQIIVFPNPAKDYITIESKEGIKEVKILDAMGRQICNEIASCLAISSNNYKTSYTVHLTSYTKGLYLLQITTTKNEIWNKKLVIE